MVYLRTRELSKRIVYPLCCANEKVVISWVPNLKSNPFLHIYKDLNGENNDCTIVTYENVAI